MMEKYGVSFGDLPPTEEQANQLLKLACELGIAYTAPSNRAAADVQLQKYMEMLIEKEARGEES